MADYDEVKNSGQKEKRGWGQMLHLFFGDSVKIDNAAKNGRSSKSFYHEFWETGLRESLKPGDYVIIQFGHNDEKNDGKDSDENNPRERGTAPWGQYQRYLTKYVTESRAKGAIPILATPIVRRAFDKTGTYLLPKALHNLVALSEVKNDSIMNYVLAMKSVARELSVPLLDMTDASQKIIEKLGPKESKRAFFCKEDDTHLQVKGAIFLSAWCAENLIKTVKPLEGLYQQPKDIVIEPQLIDFGEQFTTTSQIKALSVYGYAEYKTDENGRFYKNNTIVVSVQPPFEVSLSPYNGYTDSLTIKRNNDEIYQSLFIRLYSDSVGDYNKTATIVLNDEIHEVVLKGALVNLDKNKVVEKEWYPTMDIKELDSIINITNLLNGLEYSEKDKKRITTLNSTWPNQDIDMNSSRYIEFKVEPTEDVFINNISFDIEVFGSDKFEFTTLGANNSNMIKPDSYAVMETLSGASLNTFGFDTMIKVNKGKQYYLRIYPWIKQGSEDASILIKRFKVRAIKAK